MITAVAAGDMGAFDALVTRTRPGTWRLVRALAPDPAVAEDALQETYLAVWRGAGSFKGDVSGEAWLRGIARRQAARAWRRRKGEPVQAESIDDLGLRAGWGADPELAASAAEDRERVHAALATLSHGDREVIVLCDLEGHPGPEAAALLEITPGALRVRLHRARLRLMAALRGGTDG